MELSSLETELLMLKRDREGGRRQKDIVEVIRLCPPQEVSLKQNQHGGIAIEKLNPDRIGNFIGSLN